MRIAITGSGGLLGSYLIKEQPTEIREGMLQSNEHTIHALTRKELDVSKFDEVLEVMFKIQPDIIIHCAANGDVDSVEQNSSRAVKTDLLGTINLMTYCERLNCKFITISSNAVYDGEHPPYTEESKRMPVNFYGKIKSLADDIIEKSSCQWIIIRPILMYGWGNVRNNWVTRIVKDLGEEKTLRLVTDSYTQPTYAGEVAEAIWFLIDRNKWNESYNIATEEKVSIYEFGQMICDVFELDSSLLRRATLSNFPSIAPRPLDTSFYTKKLEKAGFVCHDIIDGLLKMKEEKNV